MSEKITILHLFPDVLNQAGDKGNILCLTKRCEWRGIDTEVIELNFFDPKTGKPQNFNEIKADFFDKIDIVFVGSGFDKQLETITNNKSVFELADKLRNYVVSNKVMLAIDAGYHLMGETIEIPDTSIEGTQTGEQIAKKTIKGFAICNYKTTIPSMRTVGNIVLDSELTSSPIVGFENHLGIVFADGLTPLGKIGLGHFPVGVEKPRVEGVHFKNFIGTDLHGPLLSKNPELADYLLQKALEYKDFSGKLKELEDTVENKANAFVVDRFCVLAGVPNPTDDAQTDKKRV